MTANLYAQSSFSEEIKLTVPRQNGPEITALQEQLIFLGYTEVGESDGWYGPKTENAVRLYQFENHLEPRGTVNEATWNSVFTELDIQRIAWIPTSYRSIARDFYELKNHPDQYKIAYFSRAKDQFDPANEELTEWEYIGNQSNLSHFFPKQLTFFYTDLNINMISLIEPHDSGLWHKETNFYFHENQIVGLFEISTYSRMTDHYELARTFSSREYRDYQGTTILKSVIFQDVDTGELIDADNAIFESEQHANEESLDTLLSLDDVLEYLEFQSMFQEYFFPVFGQFE